MNQTSKEFFVVGNIYKVIYTTTFFPHGSNKPCWITKKTILLYVGRYKNNPTFFYDNQLLIPNSGLGKNPWAFLKDIS